MDELREALIFMKAGVIGGAAILGALLLRHRWDRPTPPPPAHAEAVNPLGLEEVHWLGAEPPGSRSKSLIEAAAKIG